jgi:osmotically-inducible protein OsmY
MSRRLLLTMEAVLLVLALSAVMWAQNPGVNASVAAGGDQNQSVRTKNPSQNEDQLKNQAVLAEAVRHQLAMLPWYNVFDWLQAEVNADGKVVLRGQVVRPVTRSDAAASVKHIEGVTEVKNEIEVLPLSTFDDHTRMAMYRTIYSFNSPLFRYSEGVVPPIHIVVENGHVTLKGVVASKMDSDLAYIEASSVPYVFSVTNELRIEKVKK